MVKGHTLGSSLYIESHQCEVCVSAKAPARRMFAVLMNPSRLHRRVITMAEKVNNNNGKKEAAAVTISAVDNATSAIKKATATNRLVAGSRIISPHTLEQGIVSIQEEKELRKVK